MTCVLRCTVTHKSQLRPRCCNTILGVGGRPLCNGGPRCLSLHRGFPFFWRGVRDSHHDVFLFHLDQKPLRSMLSPSKRSIARGLWFQSLVNSFIRSMVQIARPRLARESHAPLSRYLLTRIAGKQDQRLRLFSPVRGSSQGIRCPGILGRS